MDSNEPKEPMQQHSPDVPFEIATIDGAFTATEIAAMSAFVADRVSKSAAGGGGGGEAPFTASPFSNGMLPHERLASSLFARISAELPKTYVDRAAKRWELVGPSRHVFYAAMRAGDLFGIHTDTGSVYSRDGKTLSCSKFTLLIYLGRAGEDFVGGATRFYTDDFVETACVRPEMKGRVLFFDIDRYHKADVVESGLKSWLGFELVYRQI
jgi:hypothetical protein